MQDGHIAVIAAVVLSKHHPDESLCANAGRVNGITHPEDFYTLNTSKQYYPEEQISISYRDMSLQHKALSLGGWTFQWGQKYTTLSTNTALTSPLLRWLCLLPVAQDRKRGPYMPASVSPSEMPMYGKRWWNSSTNWATATGRGPDRVLWSSAHKNNLFHSCFCLLFMSYHKHLVRKTFALI